MLVKINRRQRFLEAFLNRPGMVIITSFLVVIALGTLLLMLPFATMSGVEFHIDDALFTAVSATCVTGLVAVDTATTFTVFGKIIIILLIQVGGLGLATITSFFITTLNKFSGLKAKRIAQESTGSFTYLEIPKLLKFIIFVTAAFEILGGVVLSFEYVPRFGLWSGLGRAFFQSVSAFCNAGFDLLGDTEAGTFSSLLSFSDSPLVIITTSLLILGGGLGFSVYMDLVSWRKGKKLQIHSIIMLKATLIMTVVGTALMLAFEWNNGAVNGDSCTFGQKLLNAYFQAVSLRTAGFASVNLSALTDTSKVFSIIYMFIGAGSGSTGGGIKVTTFLVVIFSVIAEFSGKSDIVVEKHKITNEILKRSLAIMFSGLAIVFALSLVLCMTESSALASGKFGYVDILYEAASAFATVGNTSAGTPGFTTLGRLVIIPVMFLGRVGPVSLALSFANREMKNVTTVYPEAKIHIG